MTDDAHTQEVLTALNAAESLAEFAREPAVILLDLTCLPLSAHRAGDPLIVETIYPRGFPHERY